MKDTDTVLLSIRIEKGKAPPAPSREDECSKCGHPAWRANTSKQELPIICMECFAEYLRDNPDEEISIIEPTQAQIDDIRAILEKKN